MFVARVRGLRVGLLANPASITSNLVHASLAIARLRGVRLVALFGPEHGITADYLTLLETFYEEWLQGFDLCPVLTIRTDDLDFVHRVEHLDIVVQRIQDRLAGKEEVVFPSI